MAGKLFWVQFGPHKSKLEKRKMLFRLVQSRLQVSSLNAAVFTSNGHHAGFVVGAGVKALSTAIKNDYHKLADEFLSDAEAALEKSGIEDAFLSKKVNGQFDITSSSGVLTIKLGDIGSWVLNKQAPNKQIWWSSPLSGPRRFEYDESLKEWKNIRDGSLLRSNLAKEMNQVLGVNVNFDRE